MNARRLKPVFRPGGTDLNAVDGESVRLGSREPHLMGVREVLKVLFQLSNCHLAPFLGNALSANSGAARGNAVHLESPTIATA